MFNTYETSDAYNPFANRFETVQVEAYAYDKYSLEAYNQAKTLEVLEFLQTYQISTSNNMQNTFANLLDLALNN